MKRKLGRSTAILLGLALMAGMATAEESSPDVSLENEINHYLEKSAPKWEDPNTLRAFWKQGLNFATGDGNFKLKVGGRIMWDNYWVTSDDYDESVTADRQFFRRIRFYMEGTIHKNTFYKLQLDFASPERAEEDEETGKLAVSLKDAFIGLRNLGPVGFIVGHFKEPFSIEEMTSSKYITFLERSGSNQAFTPARNVGWEVFGNHLEQRLAWWAGIFRTTSDDGISVGDGDYNFTVRVAGIPFKNEDHTLLVDVAFSLRSDDTARYRARPGLGAGARLVNTGTITGVDNEQRYNVGIAYVWKSLSVQAEYFGVQVSREGAEDLTFGGWYFQVSYWLTGESRPVKGSSMSFGRVKPKRNFWDGEGGPGAWEIAYRFDTLDLTSKDILGGEQTTHTGGVNWHWNPNTRVMFNIVFSTQDPNEEDLGSVKTDVTSFIMRWQIDF